MHTPFINFSLGLYLWIYPKQQSLENFNNFAIESHKSVRISYAKLNLAKSRKFYIFTEIWKPNKLTNLLKNLILNYVIYNTDSCVNFRF